MKKTRENVGITITKMLKSLDLFDNIDKLVFVTDRQTGGANIVVALRRFTNTTLKKNGGGKCDVEGLIYSAELWLHFTKGLE
jgi:hypothetical protein